MKRLYSSVMHHKFISGVIMLALIGGGYYGYQRFFGATTTTSYVTAAVKKGTLIVSVSGTGQVSASDQIDIKPKTSGDLLYIGVKNGQEVKVGTLLFQIDTKDAQRAFQDAEISLESARIQLEELLEPPDELAILQAENSLEKAKTAKQKAEDNISQGYEDAVVAVTDVFFDLPTIMVDLRDIMYSQEIGKSETTCARVDNKDCLVSSIPALDYDERQELTDFIDIAKNNYQISKEKYDKNFLSYKSISRYSEESVIEALLQETIETLRAMAGLAKSETNMLDYWVDYRFQMKLRIFSNVTQYQASLKSYTSKVNGYLASLLKIQRSFNDNRQAVKDAEYTIRERALSLEKLIEGADELDIRSKKLSIQQKEEALRVAKENLANCSIHASFDGIVTAVNSKIKRGDSVSAATTLATLLTNQRIAGITLNEVDAAKVRVGQKTTLTFDAVEGLSITGEVAEIDVLGTVTQGVVTYNIKIIFDTQDERVKPGMSISAAIIADVKQNVLLVPNAAIKFNGDGQYVEILINNASQMQTVETGLSNDAMTEIINGLKEGDKVITQTVSNTQTSTQTTTGGGFRMPGMGGIR